VPNDPADVAALATSNTTDMSISEQIELDSLLFPAHCLLPALLLDERLELALHRLKGVVDDFAQRFVHFVRALSFIRDQLVAGWDGNVDPDAEWIPGMLGVIRMLNNDVAAADVIAEPIQARGLIANELVELVGFLDAPI
jgi:hypothetical protein